MQPKDQIDSSIEIVTPENIAFRYQLAGPFRRMPSFLIDLAIRVAIVLLAAFFLGLLGIMGGFAGIAILILLYFLLEWFYGGLFETYWNGQTPGKRIMGIRVLSVDGQPVNGLQAVMRNVLRFADMMPLVPVAALNEDLSGVALPIFFVGLVTPMFNRRFQRLGDFVVGTIVIIEEQSWLFGVSSIEDPRAAQLAEYIPANFRITQQLSRAVATYVERRKYFSAARRREIARHLAEPLLAEFRLPPDTSYDLMICALYHRAFIADQGRAEEDIMRSIGQSPFQTAHSPPPWPFPGGDVVAAEPLPVGAEALSPATEPSRPSTSGELP